MQHNNSSPSSDQVQEHDVRVDGDVVPVHVVRDGARGEEGQLQGARQRGPIRDTHWRMGKTYPLLYSFLSKSVEGTVRFQYQPIQRILRFIRYLYYSIILLSISRHLQGDTSC